MYKLTNSVDADTFVGTAQQCFAKAAVWTGLSEADVVESGFWQGETFLGGYPEESCGFMLSPV